MFYPVNVVKALGQMQAESICPYHRNGFESFKSFYNRYQRGIEYEDSIPTRYIPEYLIVIQQCHVQYEFYRFTPLLIVDHAMFPFVALNSGG